MDKLKKYLKSNRIKFEELSETTVKIDERTYELVYPNNEGKLFDDSFEMTCDDTVEDNYVFSFGGIYYWTPKGTETKPKLNILKYIGVADTQSESIPFLGIHGKMEILNGNRDYADWCKKAIFLGVKCLGICEKNTLAGTLQFQLACKGSVIKPVLGATYTVFRQEEDYRYDMKFFVKNEKGWESILLMNKEVNVINNKFVTEDRMLELLEGLFVVVDPKSLDYDRLNSVKSKIDYFQLDSVEYEDEERDHYYLLNLKKYVESDIKPILTQDAYYLDKDDSDIKVKLNQISGVREYKSHNQYFKCIDDMFDEIDLLFNIEDDRFQTIFDESVKNLNTLCDSCDFEIRIGNRFLPKYKMTEEEKRKFKSNDDLFSFLIEKGFEKLVLKEKQDLYRERLDNEIEVIEFGDIKDYFLTLWDIVRWSKENDILVGIGRGSAGGSLIGYLLNITQLDPIKFDLLFERFLNKGRVKVSLPDIDTDFEGKKRNEVKRYMENKYGEYQVCSIGTYTTLKIKAILKDFGKLDGASIQDIEYVNKCVEDNIVFNDLFNISSTNSSVKRFIKNHVEVINDIPLVYKQPRSGSVHACATLILPDDKDVFHWLPVKKMQGGDGSDILVTEWEGIELEKAGFLKEDILGILQLDKFRMILDSILERNNDKIDIYHLPLDDKKVYDFFQKGWNGDVFHFGSKGLTGYCKDLKPENIHDLIAGISLYRPGAIENNFHTEYIKRKQDNDTINYFTGSEEILSTTYGVFVYQEQIMKLCQVLGGLTLVEADDVRKAMVKKKYDELTKYKDRFISHYIKHFQVTKEYSEYVWEAIDKASTYLFNKSHATAYAITGYICQWLKVNYPLHYWICSFSFIPENKKDIYFPSYISEIHQTGDIKILPPEINKSYSEFTADFDTNTIYWSITSVKQAGEISQQQIEEDKKLNGHYFSFEEFLSRHVRKGSKVTKQIIENLVLSGVFDEIEEIKQPKDRIRLIDFYRKEYKIKIDKEKDQFTTNEDSIGTNWWWSLQQKKICGFSLFEFDLLCETYLVENSPYYDAISIDEEKEKKEVTTGGYLNELVVRNGKKGEYAEMTLDNNFEFVTVKIWQDEWKKVKPMIDGKEKILILLSGTVDHDNWKKKNVLYMNKESSICVLE